MVYFEVTSIVWLDVVIGMQTTFTLGFFSTYTRNLNTLKCLSIGTLKTIDIPYIPNGKLMFFRCPSI